MSALREACVDVFQTNCRPTSFQRLIAGAAEATALYNQLNEDLAGHSLRQSGATRTHLGRGAVEPVLSPGITFSSPPDLLAAGLLAFVHAARRSDRCKDFASVGRYLYRQEATLAAAYRVKGYAHASREHFGVVAGFLLGHEASSQVHQVPGLLTT